MQYSEGQLVLAHCHMVMKFHSQKSKEQVIDVFSKLPGFSKIQNEKGNWVVPGVAFMKCNSVAETSKYLIHQNAPDKEQYDPAKIVDRGIGVDKYLNYAETKADKRLRLQQLVDFICDNNIEEVKDLDYLVRFNPQWYDMVSRTNREYVKDLLNSARYTRLQAEKGVVAHFD